LAQAIVSGEAVTGAAGTTITQSVTVPGLGDADADADLGSPGGDAAAEPIEVAIDG
jgi:hypothetical protein